MASADINEKTVSLDEKRVIWRLIEGQMIFIDQRQGKVYELNKTGQAIWDAAAKKAKVREIIELVRDRYPGEDPDMVKKDVLDFILLSARKKFLLLGSRP